MWSIAIAMGLLVGGKLLNFGLLTLRLEQPSCLPHGAAVRMQSFKDEMRGTALPSEDV